MPDRAAAVETPIAVIATAGHVDHGKSSLVQRLTGMDPDRLAEEKRRGLTIELGYAWCTLPSGREVGFVDVPGHERFVRTMLAGVGPVRLVLFIVAADEGWRQQSEEHLEIVDVLGVDGAVVALTKCDTVDAEALARATAEVERRLDRTALAGAPLVACSSVTGAGIGALVGALDRTLAASPAPERGGRARMFVDRVFSISGAGTVVTGTLTGGPIAVGDEVHLLPSQINARIRGLQTHQRDLQRALPVSRVAANLVGVDRRDVERGEVLVRPQEWSESRVLEAKIRPVRTLTRPVTARGAFKLHVGSAEREARLRLYGVTALPDQGAFARIALSAPVVLDVGDRFVLRESGRRETVAGGVVLDTDPPRRPGPGAIERLAARERAPRASLPELLVDERGGVRCVDLARATGSDPAAINGAVRMGGWWVSDTVMREAGQVIEDDIGRSQDEHPHEPGQSISALRPAAVRAIRGVGGPNDPGLAEVVVRELIARGRLEQAGTFVRLPSRPVEHPEEEGAVVAAVRAGEPTPPSVAELEGAGFDRALVEAAVRSGALVRISPEIVLTSGFVGRALEAIGEAGPDGITVSALRGRLGTTRRFAVPLVEHLDRTGATRRAGDLRFLRAPR